MSVLEWFFTVADPDKKNPMLSQTVTGISYLASIASGPN